MTFSDINIRDPFILNADGTYYMYGTRGKAFGQKTGGFDVYQSKDLETWSDPQCCFDSDRYGMNRCVNWAPEVHSYQGAYYMFATFTGENGRRGTHILKAQTPLGPFTPHSDGPVTPEKWESLDGTLFVDDAGVPYLVFCHEHIQILDGTVEVLQLSADLKTAVTEPKTLFKGSSLPGVKKLMRLRYVTDGPFLYRTKTGALLLLWSTFIEGKYAQCIARSESGRIDGPFVHLDPLVVDDGGHGMIFCAGEKLYLVIHTPNASGKERPCLIELTDEGETLRRKE